MLKSKGVIKLIEINESWAVDTDGDKNVILMKKVTHEYDDLLVCKCDRDLFCVEDKCCGRKPTKEALKNNLND